MKTLKLGKKMRVIPLAETVKADIQPLNIWEIILRVLDEQPVSTRRRPHLQMICDGINSYYDNEPYHVMTMNDVCYIIRKPQRNE